MNYKSIFLIIAIVLLLTTLCISAKKPKMHKVALIYNSDYQIVQDSNIEKEEVNIPTITQEEQIKTNYQKLQENIEKEEKTIPVKKETVKKEKSKIEVKPVKKEVKELQPKTTVKEVKKEQPKVETKTVSKPQVKNEEVKVEKVVQQPVKTVQKEQPKVEKKVETLTKEQEDIAWNIWRSNLQNSIMKDTHLPTVPNGTIFRFSFDVDKYGKIYNIKTSSDTPSYTPYAIQYIAPVIRSYQGRSILNFPTGTQRTMTTAKGAWKISANTRYSTPNDYNDIEVINK